MMKNAEVAAPLKRRSFVGVAAAAAAALFAGPSLVSGIVRASAKPFHIREKSTVSIHPLAVPRRRKGANTNG
jgi:hypothetical protein